MLVLSINALQSSLTSPPSHSSSLSDCLLHHLPVTIASLLDGADMVRYRRWWSCIHQWFSASSFRYYYCHKMGWLYPACVGSWFLSTHISYSCMLIKVCNVYDDTIVTNSTLLLSITHASYIFNAVCMELM